MFFIEHGLNTQEFIELLANVQMSLQAYPIESGWWRDFDLPLLVVATEEGYHYRGAGTDFWPLVEEKLNCTMTPRGRQWIKDLFVRATTLYRGVRPQKTPWAEAFHLIAWPIAHALLPLEFHRPFAATLADLRVCSVGTDDENLYRAVRFAAPLPTARFATFLEDVGVVVSLTRSILRREGHELSEEIVNRFAADLEADDVARRSIRVARTIQRTVQATPEGARQLPPATRTEGRLQLRLANDDLLLEASFPPLDPPTTEHLRRSLRRRRFAPQLWGVTARIPSDQLLSGLPFPLRLRKIPGADALLFPDLDLEEFDPEDASILTGFELKLAPPHLFAVNEAGDIARLVIGSTISGHRKYWALLSEDEDAPEGACAVGEVGPLQCFELDPSNAEGARALARLGFKVRLGVSVRFAGAPSLETRANVPTYVAGDNRVLVPQRLNGDGSLAIELNGNSAAAGAMDVVRFIVEAGEHCVRVSSETDLREYAFRGVHAPPPPNAPVRVELRSEERTIQALLSGRFSFAVDSLAPIDGLSLTVDLEVGECVYSATGPLGLIPQPVSSEHGVMKALLSEEVRDRVSGAEAAILCARVGHLAMRSWNLERLVRPCWWELSSHPQLLSESGALKFGVVSAEAPVRAPIEGAACRGTYLLAPIALNQFEFGAAAPFATLCIAPRRGELFDPTIAMVSKPRLERRRRGVRGGVGLEDLTEAYLRWSLAETRSALGDIYRGQVTARIEEWIVELCCGSEWAQTEKELPRIGEWSLLEQVCQEMSLGGDGYVELTPEQSREIRRFAVGNIRCSLPALWARVGPPSDLDDVDYEALDLAFAKAYETLAERCRARGQNEVADSLEDADPGESPDQWIAAFANVRDRVELRALAEMLLPSNSAARLMALEVSQMTVDDVVEELFDWASSARKAFAGERPTREMLKACYALWIEPDLALALDWRTALDSLLVERSVARATRYLALRARQTRWGNI